VPVRKIEPLDQRPQLAKWSVREVPLHVSHQAWPRHLDGWSREDKQCQGCKTGAPNVHLGD
jgi:hypothetical protein